MLMQTQRRGGGIAPTHSPPRRQWVVSNTFQPLNPQGRTVVYFTQYFIVSNNSATGRLLTLQRRWRPVAAAAAHRSSGWGTRPYCWKTRRYSRYCHRSSTPPPAPAKTPPSCKNVYALKSVSVFKLPCYKACANSDSFNP